MPGGETEARRRFTAWRRAGLTSYGDRHDDLPGDATSRLAPYLHLGCVSPLEIARGSLGRDGAEPFVRQLAWRDFYHQVLAARPDASWADFRHRGDHWVSDPAGLDAWREGRTGFPVVDAAMRQLLREGYMHNRARMVVASFLTKDLGIDWREGARHFLTWLTDGDVANNNLNWQWTAGTGTDTNPNRIFNPTVQGQRVDPDGVYVRRYGDELAAGPVGGAAVLHLGERALVGGVRGGESLGDDAVEPRPLELVEPPRGDGRVGRGRAQVERRRPRRGHPLEACPAFGEGRGQQVVGAIDEEVEGNERGGGLGSEAANP